MMSNKEFVQLFEQIVGRKPVFQDQKDKEILTEVGRELQVSYRAVAFFVHHVIKDDPWHSRANKWGISLKPKDALFPRLRY
jgi:hypothetical protein